MFPALEGEMKGDLLLGASNKITAGINGIYDGVVAGYLQEGKKSAEEISLFIQDLVNLWGSDRYLVTPGIRFTYNTRFDPVILPKMSGRVNFTDAFFIRASVGLGYKSPSYQDNYREEWVHTGGIFVLSGNPDLRPERSRGANAAAGGRVGGNLTWEISGHATRLFDQITTREINSDTGRTSRGEFYNAVRSYVNADSAYTRGIDLNVRYERVSGLRLDFHYEYLQSRYWDELGDLLESSLYSPHIVTVSAVYRVNVIRRFTPTISAGVIWRDRQLYSDGVWWPSYTDIRASVKTELLKGVHLTFGATNILDNTYQEYDQSLGRKLYVNLSASINNVLNPFYK
jgi:Outer membrane receptor for ferrienterochelin and colicins